MTNHPKNEEWLCSNWYRSHGFSVRAIVFRRAFTLYLSHTSVTVKAVPEVAIVRLKGYLWIIHENTPVDRRPFTLESPEYPMMMGCLTKEREYCTIIDLGPDENYCGIVRLRLTFTGEAPVAIPKPGPCILVESLKDSAPND